jgi:HSP20 family molecular chaperone IbpA
MIVVHKEFLANQWVDKIKEFCPGATIGRVQGDTFDIEKDFVIRSAIAGVKPEEIDILIENDVVIIKGYRNNPGEEKADYFCQECFWGQFLKEIILPVEVDPSRAESIMKDGILTGDKNNTALSLESNRINSVGVPPTFTLKTMSLFETVFSIYRSEEE